MPPPSEEQRQFDAAIADAQAREAEFVRRRTEAAERDRLLSEKRLAETVARLTRLKETTDDRAVAERRNSEGRTAYAAHIARLLDLAGLPPLYDLADLDDAQSVPDICRPRYEKICRVIADASDAVIERFASAHGSAVPGPVVALVGPGGEGKTYMLCAAVRRLCLVDVAARYVSARRLMDELAEADRFGALRTVRQVHDGFVRPPLLAIDEVDKLDAGTDRGLRRLEQLVSDRHQSGRTTLLAGNLAADHAGVQAVLGPYVASRIQSGGATIECGWGDLRGRLNLPPAAAPDRLWRWDVAAVT